jgi:GNAT superfamily N-acetyltransferase
MDTGDDARPPAPRKDDDAHSQIRSAAAADVDALAQLWYDGWQDAHARIVPAALARYRTLDNFRQRLHAGRARVRVATSSDRLLGFNMIKDDEVYQLYVAAAARGTGVAAALLDDAEACLAANGIGTAWLGCAIGNERAAKFYRKRGWQRVGNVIDPLEIPGGTFALEVWRYEKDLRKL